MNCFKALRTRILLLAALLPGVAARADEPAVAYIFPAGGERGTKIDFRIGGMYLHEGAALEMPGPGVAASPRILPVETVWFEGPVIPLPASQQKEDYPKDYAGAVAIAADAPPGLRRWRVSTSQGATPSLKFVVGELPEVVEREADGEPLPTPVTLPVTINGRIFPREDVDEWSFEAKQGELIRAETMSARLGYPLRPRLVLLDAEDRPLAEDFGSLDGDARLSATIPADGQYRVRIHDVEFGGLQDHVYRLTLTQGPHVERVYPLGGRRGAKLSLAPTGPGISGEKIELAIPPDAPESYLAPVGAAFDGAQQVCIETSAFAEVLEAEPNDEPAAAPWVAAPAVCNGRIETPGDKDCWAFELRQGEVVELEVRAARLGSPLDSVLAILDADGKEVARADDQPNNQTDARLQFAAPQAGKYIARVEERFASRGGAAFAYRLRVAPPQPDFRLTLAADAVTLYRGATVKLRITAERLGGYAGAIKLAVEGLPPGASVAAAEIGANQPQAELVFTAEETARIGTARLRIVGAAEIGGLARSHAATLPTPRGEMAVDNVLLAVSMPTPFKVVGTYDITFVARGSVLKRNYTIERNGFAGPLEVQLADRQTRHLQGVTGPKITVPPKATAFTYEAYLPPWMELGRTSRSIVMAVGAITDGDGSRHTVSFTSQNQNEQIVALVGPGELSLQSERTSFVARPESAAEIPLRVLRGKTLAGPVKLELIVPPHIGGVAADSVLVAADAERGVMQLRFDREFGPLNMPITVRAMMDAGGKRVIAETKIELVSATQDSTGAALSSEENKKD
ncbi:MAG TPA: PPC domain-containing protein [Pirellulales bacterium]|nr:PPC domain-containing protein [Pirellulales bacterium]